MGHNFSSRLVRAPRPLEKLLFTMFSFTVDCNWLNGKHVVFGVHRCHTSLGPILTHPNRRGHRGEHGTSDEN